MLNLKIPPLHVDLLRDDGKLNLSWHNWFNNLTDKVNDNKQLSQSVTLASDESAQLDSSNFSSDIEVYEIEIINVRASALNTALLLRLSTDGSTYLSNDNDYIYTLDSGVPVPMHAIVLSQVDLSNTVNGAISGTVRIISPSSSDRYKLVHWDLHYLNSEGSLINISGSGQVQTNLPVIGAQIVPSAGVLLSGTIKIYSLN